MADVEHDPTDPKQPTGEMTAFVQNLLQQMQTRFKSMSDNIVSKNILGYEMGSRINDLDRSINQLRAEIGPDGSSSSALQKPEEEKQSNETPNK